MVVVALALALVQACILVAVARDKSDTVDEGRYLATAATLWANRDFDYLCGAPVLPMWGFAAAMRLADVQLGATPRAAPLEFVVGRSPQLFHRLLRSARAATIAVTVLGGLLLWRVACRFGTVAGSAAQALWCFSPTVLANGALATLDGWAAAAMTGVLWAATRFVERASVPRAALLGALCAVAAATKVTTLLMLPLVAALILWRTRGDRAARATAVVAGAFVLTLWAIYGFTVGAVPLAQPCAQSPILDASLPAATATVGPVPFPAWIEGAAFQVRHGREGHLNYLFGEVSERGWWWFYLACLALKVTVGAQGLSALRVASLAGGSRRALAIDAALLAYPMLLLIALSAGRHQASVAFLLPAFPFALLWLARGVADASAPRQGVAANEAARPDTRGGRRGRALFAVLVLVGIAESLRVHPHYLMFFNAWAGGPEGGPRYLVHRDDWGQDKRRLGRWQRDHGVARLFYSEYGTNAATWGIVADPVPCTPTVGVYALHAVEVHRPQYGLRPGCVDWLTIEPPDERLGYSIYIYRVDAARLERLRGVHGSTPPFWQSAREWRSSEP